MEVRLHGAWHESLTRAAGEVRGDADRAPNHVCTAAQDGGSGDGGTERPDHADRTELPRDQSGRHARSDTAGCLVADGHAAQELFAGGADGFRGG